MNGDEREGPDSRNLGNNIETFLGEVGVFLLQERQNEWIKRIAFEGVTGFYYASTLFTMKKATDQYQVIVEVADNERSAPEDLSKPLSLVSIYIKSDDGQRMIPLSAMTSWHAVIGPQAVNHINQFTSVTIFFNLKPGYSIGPATQFVETTAKQILPPGAEGALQGVLLLLSDFPLHLFDVRRGSILYKRCGGVFGSTLFVGVL